MQFKDVELICGDVRYSSITFNPRGLVLFHDKKVAKLIPYENSRLEDSPSTHLYIIERESTTLCLNFKEKSHKEEAKTFLESKMNNESKKTAEKEFRSQMQSQRKSLNDLPENFLKKEMTKRHSIIVMSSDRKSEQADNKLRCSIEKERKLPVKGGLYGNSHVYNSDDQVIKEVKVSIFSSEVPYNNKEKTCIPNTKDSEADCEELELANLPESHGPFTGPETAPNKVICNNEIAIEDDNTPTKRPSLFKRLGSFLFSPNNRGSIFSNRSSKTNESNKSGTSTSKQKNKAFKTVNKKLFDIYRVLRFSQRLKCEYKIKLLSIESSYLLGNDQGKLIDQYKKVGCPFNTSHEDHEAEIDQDRRFDITISRIICEEPETSNIFDDIDLSDIDESGVIKETKNTFKNLSKNIKDHIKHRITAVAGKLAQLRSDQAILILKDSDPAKHGNLVEDKLKQFKLFIEHRRTWQFDPEMQIYMLRVDLQFFIDLGKHLINLYDEILFDTAGIIADKSFNQRLILILNHLIAFKRSFVAFIKQQVVAYCKSVASEMRKMYHGLFNFVNDYWVFEDLRFVVERTYLYLFGTFEEMVKHIRLMNESATLFALS